MSIKFTWEESYSGGIEEIDNQHRRMFDLANAIDSRLDKSQIKRTVLDLYIYTRQHFKLEEAMMKAQNYPKYEDHMKLHENLITLLNEKSAHIYDSDEAVFSFKKFVYGWLIEHILNKDMDFFHFMNTKTG